MPEVLLYEGVAEVPSEVPSHIIDEWETTLKNMQASIYNNLMQKIPSEEAFKTRIAAASSDAWEVFVNPNYKNANVIKMKQRIKLAKAWGSWNAGVKNAYDGDSPYFADRVTQKKDKYQLARYTIAFVGSKPDKFWGPAPKAILLLTGDLRASRYITANETLSGSPQNAILPEYANYVRPMVISKVVFAGVMVYFAQEAGLADLRDNVIRSANQELEKIVNAFLDTSKYVAGGLTEGGDYKDPTAWTGTYVHLWFDESSGKVKVRARAETSA